MSNELIENAKKMGNNVRWKKRQYGKFIKSESDILSINKYHTWVLDELKRTMMISCSDGADDFCEDFGLVVTFKGELKSYNSTLAKTFRELEQFEYIKSIRVGLVGGGSIKSYMLLEKYNDAMKHD